MQVEELLLLRSYARGKHKGSDQKNAMQQIQSERRCTICASHENAQELSSWEGIERNEYKIMTNMWRQSRSNS